MKPRSGKRKAFEVQPKGQAVHPPRTNVRRLYVQDGRLDRSRAWLSMASLPGPVDEWNKHPKVHFHAHKGMDINP